MRARLECGACSHIWTGQLHPDDTGRRTQKTRCCARCHAWKTARIVEVFEPTPERPPVVCSVDGCGTVLHSWAGREGRDMCTVHDRARREAELAAERADVDWGDPEGRRVDLDAGFALIRELAATGQHVSRERYRRRSQEFGAPAHTTMTNHVRGGWFAVLRAAGLDVGAAA